MIIAGFSNLQIYFYKNKNLSSFCRTKVLKKTLYSTVYFGGSGFLLNVYVTTHPIILQQLCDSRDLESCCCFDMLEWFAICLFIVTNFIEKCFRTDRDYGLRSYRAAFEQPVMSYWTSLPIYW